MDINIREIPKDAFKDKITILSVNFGENCKIIGEEAFSGCVSLSEINEKNVIKEIGSSTFANTNISSVKFNKLKTIGDAAFCNCKKLSNIEIPSCRTIPSNAFEGCSSLNYINAEICLSVWESMFKDFTNLSYINLKYCNKIDNSAFEGCSSLNSINIDSCRYIGNSAFKECGSLSTIQIQNCSIINANAFEGCSSLKNVYSNDNYFSKNKISIQIKESAFVGCSSLQNINLQNHQISEIGSSAFSGCSNLVNVNFNYGSSFGLKKNYIIYENAFSGCSSLAYFNFKNCIAIGSAAFVNCSSLEKANFSTCYGSRILLRRYRSIEENAFAGCSNLKYITLPYNVSDYTYIGNSAFYNCNKLSGVYIIHSNKNKTIPIGSYVFYSGDGETSKIIENIKFYIHNKVWDLYNKASDWSVYKKYMVQIINDEYQIMYTSNTNEEIEIKNPNAYGGVSEHNYTKDTYGLITFNEKIEKLNKKIFKDNDDLVSINLPFDCTEIGDKEFEGCSKLETFNPSPGNVLKKIGNYAFKDCTSLKSFTIPKFIETLGEGIFVGCSNIEKFEGEFVNYNKKAIVYKNTLISVAKKSIGNGNFLKISDIISDIDGDINRIGESCFSGFDNIKRVDIDIDIPKSGISIGDFAFEGCNNLNEVHFYEGYPKSIGENAFGIFEKNENGEYVKNENGEYVINEKRKDFKIFIPVDYYVLTIDDTNESDVDWVNIYRDYIYPEPKENQIICYYDNSKIETKTINDKTVKIGNIINKDILSKVLIGDKITKIDDSTFKNCTNLEYIYLPNSIKVFGRECFYNCKKLTSIHIPNYHTYSDRYITKEEYKDIIKEYKDIINGEYDNSDIERKNVKAGYNQNSNEQQVEIAKLISATTFGDNIFYGCENLKEFISYDNGYSQNGCISEDGRCYIEYNDDGNKLMFFAPCDPSDPSNTKYNLQNKLDDDVNVTKINKYAFSGLTNITSITLNGKMKEIGDCAFKNCTSLSSISLPTELTTIGESASGLTSISLLTELTTIGESAFEGCSGLTSILLPSTLTTICNSAFYGCSGLTSISLPTELTTIGESAFEGCSSMFLYSDNDEYKFPTGIIEIGARAFMNCDNFKCTQRKKETGGVGKFEYTSVDLNLENIKINKETFKNCTSLSNTIKIENTNSIGESVFEGCTSLLSVEYYSGSGIVDGYNNKINISKRAFKNCTKLRSISLPSNLETICDESFYGCNNLTNIALPETNIALPENTIIPITIGNSAFEGCSKLSSISNCENIKTISDFAFKNCTKLSSISLESNSKLTTIGNSAFYGCSGLESISLPSKLTTIGNHTFEKCSKLSGSLIFPYSIKTIGEYCFADTNIESLVIQNDIVNNKYSELTEIPYRAFYNCKKLNSINIFNIKQIRDESFFNAPIVNIDFYNITHFGNRCFEIENIMENDTIKKIDIYLRMKLGEKVYPPIFTFKVGSGNRANQNAVPFGEPNKNKKLIIHFDKDYYKKYIEDRYWKKYKNYFSTMQSH
jgi:hypothetical protein